MTTGSDCVSGKKKCKTACFVSYTHSHRIEKYTQHKHKRTHTRALLTNKQNVQKSQRTLNFQHTMNPISLQLLCALITICFFFLYYSPNEHLFIRFQWIERFDSPQFLATFNRRPYTLNVKSRNKWAHTNDFFFDNFGSHFCITPHTDTHDTEYEREKRRTFNLNTNRLTFHWWVTPEIRWKE